MEGLKVSNANLMVYVHPSKANKVSDAIYRELSSLLFKFSETFDGVVLAYDVGILSKQAKILPGIHPYLGVKLHGSLLLFHPKPGMLLEGKVVKISQQSIHMIILGFSSATVMEEDIREEFTHKVKHGEELFESKYHRQNNIKVGTIVRFFVNSFDEEILHISGSLAQAHTGNICWLDKNLEDRSRAESSSKKRKRIESTMEMSELDKVEADVNMVSQNKNFKSKKSKKHRSDGYQ